MTEKRFKTCEVLDNVIYVDDTIIGEKRLLEVLNENEGLKTKLDYHQRMHNKWQDEALSLQDQLDNAYNKNEQLKQDRLKWIANQEELECLSEENKQLKQALKNSYINEICENCKYGNYFKTDNFIGGFEWDFECTKKHFGNDHWKCDGLTECDDFELKIKSGDVE